MRHHYIEREEARSTETEMAQDDAPDLRILGDEITLQPPGYVKPEQRPHHDEKEEALMHHMARFRSEPLQFVPPVCCHECAAVGGKKPMIKGGHDVKEETVESRGEREKRGIVSLLTRHFAQV